MKRYLILSLFPFMANAATIGNITLTGLIPANRSISVSPQGSYSNLDLVGNTTNSNYLIANVQEKSNALTGYKVTLSSLNSGKLMRAGSVTEFLAYTATYNGAAVTLSSTAVIVTNVTSQTSVVNTTKPLRITYTAFSDPSDVLEATYSDTLTFTISAP